jgi:PhzF family phenazine biosynthesis protein
MGVVFLKIAVYQVDAFTSRACKGNPAAVCLADDSLTKDAMQDIAAEMNLSETAFIQSLTDESLSDTAKYSIRWFTPKMEMPLCGHATLAASKVIFDCLGFQGKRILFRAGGEEFESRRNGGGFTLDFPPDQLQEPGPVSDLLDAMGIRRYKEKVYGRKTGKLVIRLHSTEEVRSLRPDFKKMTAVKACFPIKGVGVTAEGDGYYDIISRYFNPWAGVNEDPVTGSVHTVLAPYWASILGKKEIKALQASERCGEIMIKITENGRLEFTGKAVVVLQGEIYL